MDKRGIGPISFQRTLQTIRPKLISNVLNRMKGNGRSRGEGGGVSADGHTGGRKRSCQTFVREGIRRREKIPLLVIDAEVANTRED